MESTLSHSHLYTGEYLTWCSLGKTNHSRIFILWWPFKSSSLKGFEFQADLLDVAFLDSLFIQVFYELLSLHPVDERADVAAVPKKRSTGQVQSISCRNRRWPAVSDCPVTAMVKGAQVKSYLCLTITAEK